MLKRLRVPAGAILFSLAFGAILILAAGVNPLVAYARLLQAGFGCDLAGSICALLTTLQYATPLILSGLSALVAFRAGVFSLGQAGQMILGAGFATYAAWRLPLGAPVLTLLSLLAAMAAGAVWGLIPGVLKTRLQVNEIIVTILLNPIALLVVAPLGFRRIPELARLAPLARGSKLNIGIFIALALAALIAVYLWRTGAGYALRMAGEAWSFARFGGIRGETAILRAMVISGALAGLAGAIEVLGVQYRFVSQFSAIDEFDGVIVALIGQLHPLGVVLGSFALGGIRLGALNGLQLQAAVPRELGSALIALLVLFFSAPQLYQRLQNRE